MVKVSGRSADFPVKNLAIYFLMNYLLGSVHNILLNFTYRSEDIKSELQAHTCQWDSISGS
jgi:hypothetical protein